MKKMWRKPLAGILILGFFVAPFQSALAATSLFPKQINYQAKLTDGSGVAVADGNYNITFRLYTAPSGATTTNIWEETHTGGNRVPLTSGLLSVLLGQVTSLATVNFNQTLYLGVEIGGSAVTPVWDGEMTPRKQLGAVPAALVADTLDGLDSSAFVQTNSTSTIASSSAQTLLTLNQSGTGNVLDLIGASGVSVLSALSSGNVGIGTTSPFAKLSVVGTTELDGNVVVKPPFTFGNGPGSFVLNANTSGAAIPSVPHQGSMHIVGNDNDFAALYVDTFGSFGGSGGDSYRSLVNLRSARGTLAAPLPGLAGDEVGRIAGRGYNGTAFTGSLSALSFMLAEPTTATAQGSYAIMRTTAIGTTGGGSTTVPPETVRFQPSGGLSVGDSTFNATDPGHGSVTLSGNLGIGTTSPFATLSVAGIGSFDDYVRASYFTGTSTATSTFGGNLAINGTGTTTAANGINLSSGCFAVGGNCLGGQVLAGTLGQVPYYAGAGSTLTGTSSLFIGANGYVGVNNTSPTAYLDVNLNFPNSNAFKVRSSNGGGVFTLGDINDLQLRYTSGAGFQTNQDYVVYSSGVNGGSTGGGSFFKINPSVVDNTSYILNVQKNSASYLSVMGNGNVGVGTSSPYAKLSVAGNVVADSFNATSTTGYLLNGVSIATGSTTKNNFYFASATGTDINLGTYNIAMGANAMQYATSGARNFAVGQFAMQGAAGNGNTGTDNNALGFQSLSANTTGSYNNALGQSSLRINTTGSYNNAIGVGALNWNSTGSGNNALGANALTFNADGTNNNAIGQQALYWNSVGSGNNAFGYEALYNSHSASSTAVGSLAGFTNITGSNNLYLGDEADGLAGTYSNSAAIGSHAKVGASNALVLGGTGAWAVNVGIGTTSPYAKLSVVGQALADSFNATSSVGYQLGGTTLLTASASAFNTFVGLGAGTSTTIGTSNTFVGYQSGQANTTGLDNVANGRRSLFANTSGFGNTANGSLSLYSNTIGNDNTASGYLTLFSNISGSANTASGRYALYNNTTGSDNTASGYRALQSNTTGSSNVGVGDYAGYSNINGASSTFLGMNAGYTDGTTATLSNLTNVTAIGYNAQVTQSNSLILGGKGAYAVNVGIGTTSPFATLSVAGIGSFDDYVRASYFTGTSTATSTFAGGLSLGGGGLYVTNGGMRIASTQSCGKLYTDANGVVLCGVDAGAGGTSEINWTWFNGSGVRIATTSNQVLVGGTATTSLAQLEVQGSQYLSGNLGIGTTSPYAKLSVVGQVVGSYFTATTTAATSTFTNVTTTGLFGVGTTSPSGTFAVNGGSYLTGGSTGAVSLTTQSGDPADLANIQDWRKYDGTIVASVLSTGGLAVNRTTSSVGYSHFGPSISDFTPSASQDSIYGAKDDSTGIGTYRAITGLASFSSASVASSGGHFGLNGFAYSESNQNLTSNASTLSGGLTGGRYAVRMGSGLTGSPLISLATGVSSGFSDTLTTGTPFITDFAPFHVESSVSGHTTITNQRGLWVRNASVSGAGSIANQYGVYIDNLTAGANNYSIYTGTANSVFGGSVGIGTTSPYAKLSVVGQALADSFNATSSVGYQLNGMTIATASTTKNNFYFGGATTTSINLGTYNIAMGPYAMETATSGANNFAAGYQALRGFSGTVGQTGDNNNALGYQSLWKNTTGSANNALGYNALYNNFAGNNNNAIGYNALFGNANGVRNTAIGYQSMYFNNGGSYNNVIGGLSMGNGFAGSYNSGVGDGVMYNVGGSYNSAIGTYALFSQFGSTGNSNSALGYSSLYLNAGASSTAVGAWAGFNNVTGNNNLYLGDEADGLAGTYSNSAAIGSHAKVGASNALVLGGTGAWAVNVGIGTSTPFAKLSIQNTFGSQAALFDIATSTNASGSATTSLFRIDASGAVNVGNPSSPVNGLLNVNGVIQAATGTSALPGYTFGNNGGSGLFMPRSRAVALTAFGTELVTADAMSSAVGIGTTSPFAKLSVAGAGSFDDYIRASYFTGTSTATSTFGGNLAINGTGTTTSNGGFNITAGCFAVNGTCVGNVTGGASSGIAGTVQFSNGTGSFSGDATNFFWDNTLKNLGIGTSSPYAKLSVAGQIVGSYFTGTSTASSTFGGNVSIASGQQLAFGGTPTLTLQSNGAVVLGNLSGSTRGNLALDIQTTHGATEIASGGESVAVGAWNKATGFQASNAIGYYNYSLFDYNNAFGDSNVANGGNNTSAFGSGNNALGGNRANAFGGGNVASSTDATAFGNTNKALGTVASAFGYKNIASGGTSISFGATNTVSSLLGAAFGYNNYVTAQGASAFGHNITNNTASSTMIGPSDVAKLTIDSTGSLGIGTTSPFAKLSVVGQALADSFNATSSVGYQQGGVTLLTGSSTLQSTFVGFGAGTSTTASYNTVLGYWALQANTSGGVNTAIGHQALMLNTASYNTAVGGGAMKLNTAGTYNVAVGSNSLASNTTGSQNTAIGDWSLNANTTGLYNTANGQAALSSNTSGSNNTANGAASLYGNTIGSDNTAIGLNSGYKNTTGASSTFVGRNAGYNNVTGSFNTFLGFNAGYTDGTTATLGNLTNATAIGSNAQVTQSNSLILGGTGAYAVNVGVGTTSPYARLSVVGQALADSFNATSSVGYQLGGTTLLTASSALANTFLGFGSGVGTLSSGVNNTFIGNQTGALNTSGSQNTFVGDRAGYNNATGTWNSFFGQSAGYTNTIGESNSFFGRNSGELNTIGTGNSFFGRYSGYNNTTGNSNTFVGMNAGYSDGTTASLGNLTNASAIGYGAQVRQSNSLVLGGTGSYAVNVGIGTTSPYAKLSVVGNVVADSFNATSSVGYKLGGTTLLTASSTGLNTFLGFGTGTSTTSGSANTFVGYQSGQANTVGVYNSAMGWQSLFANTAGDNNVAIGPRALYANTSGSFNVALGSALVSNISGTDNVGLGQNALFNNTSGINNFAAGPGSQGGGCGTGVGNENISIGSWSLACADASYNIGLGSYALTSTLGSGNVAIGWSTLMANSTGASSTALGTYAGFTNTSGSNNLYLGDEADALATGYSNSAAIGSHAKVGASNSLVLGGTGAWGVNVGIGSTTPSSMLTVVGTTTIGSMSTAVQAGLQIGNGGLCVDNDGTCVASTTGRISAVSYTTGSTDLAENYFSTSTLQAGNIVMMTATDTPAYIALGDNASTNKIIGVVSTKPAIILGLENDMPLPNQYPIALAGRVPVSVNLENGPIKRGDRITISSIPGVGAKAIATSSVSVAIALEDWSGVPNVMDTMATGTVLAFVSLAHSDLSAQISGSQFNLTASSSGELVPLFGLDEDTQDVRYLANRPFNFSAQSLVNVRSIVSSSGKWSIDENGRLIVEDLEVKGSVKVGSPENPTGVTLFDQATGAPYCIKVVAGVLGSAQGECGKDSGMITGVTSPQTGGSTPAPSANISGGTSSTTDSTTTGGTASTTPSAPSEPATTSSSTPPVPTADPTITSTSATSSTP